METKTAEQMMVPIDEYPYIPETMTLAEAIRVLGRGQIVNADNRISSPRVLLVCNDQSEFVGIVRRRDILQGLQPGSLRSGPVKHQRTAFGLKVDSNLLELSHDKLAEGMRSRAQRPIKDVMRPIVATVNHDDHLVTAMNQQLVADTSVLPVVKQGKVIGVLRTIDVMFEIAVMLGIRKATERQT
jgi:predicted transcriptional regulator